MIKVGIVGGTGYTGAELIRLLINHSEVEITAVTSRSDQGTPVSDIYPNLRGHIGLSFVAPDMSYLKNCDLVFFATPHGVAQSTVPEMLNAGIKVIDLSADFRIRDVAVWEQWFTRTLKQVF
mgnify:CR=1 FL=1